MTKEFNLSDKLTNTGLDLKHLSFIRDSDVKEFIRLLKECVESNQGRLPIGFINKLAGESLI